MLTVAWSWGPPSLVLYPFANLLSFALSVGLCCPLLCRGAGAGPGHQDTSEPSAASPQEGSPGTSDGARNPSGPVSTPALRARTVRSYFVPETFSLVRPMRA